MSEICPAIPYDASRYFKEEEIEALSGCISRGYLMTLKRPGSSYEREIFFPILQVLGAVMLKL